MKSAIINGHLRYVTINTVLSYVCVQNGQMFYNSVLCTHFKRVLKGSDCVFYAGQVYHVGWNISPGFTCRTTIIFGTLKDNSLKLIVYHKSLILATGTHSKWRQHFCQEWFEKTRIFVKKLKILYMLDNTIWFKFR